MHTSKIGRDFVALEWKHPKEDGGSRITKYIIKKKDDKKTDWARVATTDGSDRKVKIDNLTEGTKYYFSVAAENKAGSGPAAEMPNGVIPVKELSKLMI